MCGLPGVLASGSILRRTDEARASVSHCSSSRHRADTVPGTQKGKLGMLKLSVVGNIGSAPELKYSANGSPFLRFNVASNGRVRDQHGNWSDETTWVRVTVFGQRAETLSQHLRKGQRVFVDGRLEARPWTGQNGQISAGLELVATDCEFFSSKTESGSAGRNADDSNVPF